MRMARAYKVLAGMWTFGVLVLGVWALSSPDSGLTVGEVALGVGVSILVPLAVWGIEAWIRARPQKIEGEGLPKETIGAPRDG
jgi:hypothetical protein